MAIWTKQYIEQLPNSSFAYVDASNRLLPFKDADGNVDPDHARTALARLSQTNEIPAEQVAGIESELKEVLAKADQNKNLSEYTEDGIFKIEKVELDSNGLVPSRLQLMETGNWPNSLKGDFQIAVNDLEQIKTNFDKGIGFPTEDASTGLAVDFMHNYAAEAAAWIKGLSVEIDPTDPTRAKLFADPVEWTDAGRRAVQSGDFKCISPSGYFGSKNGGKNLSMWSNPRNLKEKVANVLDGAGLTNIPFLRGMTPIRADREGENVDNNHSGYANVIYIVHDQEKNNKEQLAMNIDELRVKERKELSVPELDFLSESKEQLSAEELKKFQLNAKEVITEEKETLSEDDKNLLAAIKAGDKVVADKESLSADQQKIADLEKVALDYKTEKAKEIVDGHVSRGAIKQDANAFWLKSLLSAEGDARKELETQLAALPANQELSKEVGTGEDTNAGSTAREQLAVIANQKVQEAAKEGKELLIGDAMKLAIRENKELAEQDKKEQGVA